MEAYMIPCLFKTVTGIPCPGCGGQRSLLYLFHGEFQAAFLMYPAIYPLLLLGLLLIGDQFYNFRNLTKWISVTALLTVAAILLHYGIELIQFY